MLNKKEIADKVWKAELKWQALMEKFEQERMQKVCQKIDPPLEYISPKEVQQVMKAISELKNQERRLGEERRKRERGDRRNYHE